MQHTFTLHEDLQADSWLRSGPDFKSGHCFRIFGRSRGIGSGDARRKHGQDRKLQSAQWERLADHANQCRQHSDWLGWPLRDSLRCVSGVTAGLPVIPLAQGQLLPRREAVATSARRDGIRGLMLL